MASSSSLTSIAGATNGFVAGGLAIRGERFSPALWASRDGRGWKRERIPPSPAGTDGAVQTVVRVGSGAVAVVNEIVRGPVYRKRIALLASGGGGWRWVGTVATGALAARGACVDGGSTMVVGVVQSGAVERGAIWERAGGTWRRVLLDRGSAAAGCSVRGGVAVVVGVASAHAAVWRRSSAGSWTRVPVAGDLSLTGLPRALAAVTAAATGFVGVGADGARGEYDLGVWTSLDGLSWRLVRTTDAAYRESGYQRASAVALDGRGRILVGGRIVGSGALWEGSSPLP